MKTMRDLLQRKFRSNEELKAVLQETLSRTGPVVLDGEVWSIKDGLCVRDATPFRQSDGSVYVGSDRDLAKIAKCRAAEDVEVADFYVFTMIPVTDEQPAPVPNDRPAVWDLVIADMKQRDEDGRAKYGVPLQPHNGRVALVDAYQEVLDLAVYMRQEIAEREDLERQLHDIRAELGRAKHERDNLCSRLDESNTRRDHLHEQLESTRRALRETQADRDKILSLRNELAGKLDALRSTLSSVLN